jgi:hypothetical protein
MGTKELIARHLCHFMDDEWALGRKLYMAEAEAILDIISYQRLIDALAMADDLLSSVEISDMAKKARVRGFTQTLRHIKAVLAETAEDGGKP